MKKASLVILLVLVILTLPIMLGVNYVPDIAKNKASENNSYVGSSKSEKEDMSEDNVQETSSMKNDEYLVLANKQNILGKDYMPNNLVEPDVNFLSGSTAKKMEKVAADAFEEMVAAAKKDNVNIVGVSGYRSYGRQAELYNSRVKALGKAKAEEYTAPPGASEHQTGLTIDLNTPSYGKLEEGFENTKAFKWLMENSYKYGFILRYPKGKEQITGYSYEPWHFRYIGEYHATQIMEKGLTLEEYLNQKIKA